MSFKDLSEWLKSWHQVFYERSIEDWGKSESLEGERKSF